MTNEELLAKVNEIVSPHGLRAEIFKDIYSVGVGGDERTYTLVANLIGPFSNWELLGDLSREISNTLPINRVTYQIT
ncbi:MAG: hypothetical protein G01um101470_817 [Parcubacteria group bacterium Gr01-1014_70]|nr:MAG: hypothetical protein G01um101470_817 [Parcubacteria group bacterium Gr01-1014_70]